MLKGAPRTLDLARAAHVMRMAGELRDVMSHLEQAGIDVLAFKGPVLAAFAFEGLERMLSGDLDLLVTPEQRNAALDALAALGYVADDGHPPALFEGDNEVVLRSAGRTEIDLHWSLAPVYWMRFDLSGAFERSQYVELIGHRFRTLGTEDMLLGLAIHHARHCWERPEYVRDIVHIVRRHSVDWTCLDRLAAVAGARRVVALALLLAERRAPGLVPPEVLRAASAGGSLRSALQRIERNFEIRPHDYAGTIDGARLQLALCDSWTSRWNYVIGRSTLVSRRDARAGAGGFTAPAAGSVSRLVRLTGKILRHG